MRWIIRHLADQGMAADLHEDEEEAVHFSDEALALAEYAKRLRGEGHANFSAADHAKFLCLIIDEVLSTHYMREILDRHIEEVRPATFHVPS